MKTIKIKRKNGFSILAIILVIITVIVAIGIWAGSNSVMASSIVNDSSSIKLAYDSLVIQGASNIIFMPNVASNGSTSNILDPLNGIETPRPSAKAINTDLGGDPTGIWVLNKNFGSMLSPSNPDAAIVLSGIKDSVCKSINKTLYGSETIPEYGPASGAPY